MDDDLRAGCPRTNRTPELIAKVRVALADNRRSMIRMLAKQFHIDKETISKLITEDLGKEKLCARFVPHVLMSEQWKDRVTSSRNFLQMQGNNPEFFNKIITDDESWCFTYGPERKCQSETWVGPQSPKAMIFCFEKSCIKTMLVTFFDS